MRARCPAAIPFPHSEETTAVALLRDSNADPSLRFKMRPLITFGLRILSQLISLLTKAGS